MKKLIILFLTISVGWMIWSPHARAVEIKGGYFFNYTDGEQKPIVAVEIYSFDEIDNRLKDLSVDLWATDLDELVNGISNDWQGGLALSYKLPVKIKNLSLALGYAIGARRPLDDIHEFIHGVTTLGLEWEF